MSGSNMEPLPFVRKFGGATADSSRSLTSMATDQQKREMEFASANNVDVSGVAIVKPTVTGACRKCGFPGHHAFQCYNSIVPHVRPEAKPFIDVSSTSSDDSDDHTALKKEKKKKHKSKKDKKEKKMKKTKKEKKKKERKRRHSSDSESSSDDSERERKRRKKEKKSKERRRSRSRSRD